MFGRKKESVDLVPQCGTWSPASMFEDVERLLVDLRSGTMAPTQPMLLSERARLPMLDLSEEKDRYLLQVELPGMNKDDVSIETDGDVLRINASRELRSAVKEDGYLRKERGSMRFYRQMPIPNHIDREGIKAKMENGVLDIALPKVPEIEGRKNKIEVE